MEGFFPAKTSTERAIFAPKPPGGGLFSRQNLHEAGYFRAKTFTRRAIFPPKSPRLGRVWDGRFGRFWHAPRPTLPHLKKVSLREDKLFFLSQRTKLDCLSDTIFTLFARIRNGRTDLIQRHFHSHHVLCCLFINLFTVDASETRISKYDHEILAIVKTGSSTD